MMNYSKRREKFIDKLPDLSIALVYAGKSPVKVADEYWPFEVDRDFYYLTGLDKENLVYMVYKNGDDYSESLFVERYDETMAKWVGGKVTPEEASKISGIEREDIFYLDELEDTLSFYFSRFTDITLCPCLRRESINDAESYLEKLVSKIQSKYPYLLVLNSADYLSELRLIKDKDEIACLRKAISITNEALKLTWHNLKAGMNEAEAEAYFDFYLKKEQAGHSFDPIFASGKNAVTLHYSANNSVMNDNELLLTDLGASYKYLCADISRTVPINGKFTERQKEIYETVLRCNKHIISYIRPGLTLRDLNNEAIAFYEKELPKLGLKKDVSEYYFHGVSHMLGIQTHDVGFADYKIKNGNVFTVEPGLYIEEEGIGIRIEDNVYIRNNTAEVLSKDIIKEVKDIEDFFKSE